MKSTPSPELRALADQLFAAARAEQPGAALGRRLALLQTSDVTELAPNARRAPRHQLARWSPAVAVLLASAAGLWLMVRPQTDSIYLSPERTSGGAAAAVAAPRAREAEARLAQEQPATAKRAAERSTAAERAPAAVAAPQRHAPAARTAQRHARVATAEPARPAKAATPEPGAAPSTLRAELELLKQARSALRGGNGQRALELLDGHARQSTGSALAAEAMLLRIEALSALERRREASKLAERFLGAYPNSALGDRARSFVQGSPASP